MFINRIRLSLKSFCFTPTLRYHQSMTRYVEKKIVSNEQGEGVGARVRRAIGSTQVREEYLFSW